MTEAGHNADVSDKLACEHERQLLRQKKLLNATRKVLAQKNPNGLHHIAADAARELIGARYAATGHGYISGTFAVGVALRSEGAVACPTGETFNVNKGGVYLDLIQKNDSLRLTDAEMRSHSAWWGLPEGHVPLRGLLGARLVDEKGRPSGLLIVSDKVDGGDFTAEDETILSQLAAIVSLALQHIDARLEMQLKEVAEKYSTIFNTTSDGVLIHNLSSEILEVNDAYCRMSGYSRDELIHMPISIFEVIETPDDIANHINRLIETGGHDRFESRHRRKDGSIFDVDITALYFKEDGGRVAVFIRDITERKRAEEELRKSRDELERRVQERTAELVKANMALAESEDRFKVALKNSPILVFNQDRDLRYTWVHNPHPAFDADAIIGKTDEDLFLPEDAYQLTKIKRRVLESGFGERAEVKTTINGEELVHDLTVEPLRSAEGEIEGIACSSMDITYRKRAEEELRRAKEAAEAASKAKAEFLANMSHEIRTPMNAVIGMTDLMLDENEPLSPEQRDNLEIIRTSGDTLLTIINDILDFSKMESDKVVLEEQSFNLRQCVEESLDLVALKATEKGLNLAYTIDKNVPDTIIGDPTRLRQILGNLLSNAVKFTDEGEVILSVSIIDKVNEIHFAVQDTGIGISQECMGQLFQPFSQMEPSTTRLYGGTGLGLAISRKLVELMEGRIWAKSEIGIGSTFHFTIRTYSDEPEIRPTEVHPGLVGKSVLIASENKTNRRILSKQVYDWGMMPIIAISGEEALKYISRGDDFDIAVLDMNLRDMSGLGLEVEIRKYNKTLPLVLLISFGQQVPPDHAYLTKPIRTFQLHKVLFDILSNQQSKKPMQASSASGPSQIKGQINSIRILLAEDNVSSQKVALHMLEKLGYKADIVANGIEALLALEQKHYDVVLMDLKMPEMDGLEATRVIRQRWSDKGPKVIAITAYASRGDREKCFAAGMDDYIPKPVTIEDLAKVLEKHGFR